MVPGLSRFTVFLIGAALCAAPAFAEQPSTPAVAQPPTSPASQPGAWPTELRQAADLFSEALTNVDAYYVDKPDTSKLLVGAADGIVGYVPAIADDPSVSAIKSMGQDQSVKQQLDRMGALFYAASLKLGSNQTARELAHAAIAAMISVISPGPTAFIRADTHEDADTGGVGVTITREGNSTKIVALTINGPAANAGVRRGDLIVKVDGVPAETMSLDAVLDKVRGPKDSPVTVSIVRGPDTTPFDVAMKRALFVPIEVRAEGDIAYVKVSRFGASLNANLIKAIEDIKIKMGANIKGFVLDLRSNSGGLLDESEEVADDFLERGVICMSWGRAKEDAETRMAQLGDIAQKLPVVVLTDGTTASGAEVVAAALQDAGRARVVGAHTAGAGLIRTLVPLSDKSQMSFTTARLIRPSGFAIEGIGVEPDMVVAEPNDVASNADPVLEAALKTLRDVKP